MMAVQLPQIPGGSSGQSSSQSSTQMVPEEALVDMSVVNDPQDWDYLPLFQNLAQALAGGNINNPGNDPNYFIQERGE